MPIFIDLREDGEESTYKTEHFGNNVSHHESGARQECGGDNQEYGGLDDYVPVPEDKQHAAGERSGPPQQTTHLS